VLKPFLNKNACFSPFLSDKKTKCDIKQQCLRTVPPFVTAHTFSPSRDIQVSKGICPPVPQYFCAAYDYVEKVDLNKGYQNQKRKFGVTTHFSEIIELKCVKKLPFILCILALFWNYGCLIISKKWVVTHIFLLGFQ